MPPLSLCFYNVMYVPGHIAGDRTLLHNIMYDYRINRTLGGREEQKANAIPALVLVKVVVKQTLNLD